MKVYLQSCLMAVVMAVLMVAGCAAPLLNVNITPPPAGTDPALAAFSGIHDGAWSDGSPTSLSVVDVSNPDDVKVGYTFASDEYYSPGVAHENKKNDGNPITAKFSKGFLILRFKLGMTISFKMEPDGTTLAKVLGKNPAQTTLHRRADKK